MEEPTTVEMSKGRCEEGTPKGTLTEASGILSWPYSENFWGRSGVQPIIILQTTGASHLLLSGSHRPRREPSWESFYFYGQVKAEPRIWPASHRRLTAGYGAKPRQASATATLGKDARQARYNTWRWWIINSHTQIWSQAWEVKYCQSRGKCSPRASLSVPLKASHL